MCTLSFVIFQKPLKAASACAISFRGMDFAKLLTDSIIQKIRKLHQPRMLSELRSRPCFYDEACMRHKLISHSSGLLLVLWYQIYCSSGNRGFRDLRAAWVRFVVEKRS
jgi:hypothetical protein